MAKIRNKKTGQIIEVPDNQLSRYGISAPTPQPTPTPTPNPMRNAGMVGSIAGGLTAPWPLSALTTAAGAYGGKSMEQGRAPIPASPGIEAITSLLDPNLYKEMQAGKPQEEEALKYAMEQAGVDLAAGGIGAGISSVGKKALGPLSKVKLGTPKTVQRSANAANKEVNDAITLLLSSAKEKGGKINTGKIINKLDELIEGYGTRGARNPQAIKNINKVKQKFVDLIGGAKGKDFVTYEKATDLLTGREIKKDLADIVWTEAGTERALSGAGKAGKKAAKIAGGDIRDQLSKQVEKYLGKGKSVDDLFEESKTLTKLSKSMNKPLAPRQSIGSLMLTLGALGALGYGAGGIPGVATGVGIYGASQIPFFKFLAQKAGGEALKLGGKAVSPLAKLIQNNTQ